MKKMTIYVDGNGEVVEKVKRVQAYETADGCKFHGENAKMRATSHERKLAYSENKTKYFEKMRDMLDIGFLNEPAEEELIGMFKDEGFLEPSLDDFDDVLEAITDFFSLFDEVTLKGLVNVFLVNKAHSFKGAHQYWNSEFATVMYDYN